MSGQPQQLWGGHLDANAGETVGALVSPNKPLLYDARLFADDIDASKAYAEALTRAGFLSANNYEKIINGLELVRYKWIQNLVEFVDGDEDVHTVNERLLTQLIGDVGQRLHTGRSRNDLVITVMKLWLRKAMQEIVLHLISIIDIMSTKAKQHLRVLMPGYTHLQRSQTVQFSHWLLSHAFALREDCVRLLQLKERANTLPLGSGTLAGSPLDIDRCWLAERLSFKNVTANSMHAVSDRDFVLDFIFCCSVCSLHLSRLADDLIIYATREFDFISIADSCSTGSNVMPQKHKSDGLELVRGISGAISSSLTGAMMITKGTPSTYNKDLQFDKQYCFQSFDNLSQAMSIMRDILDSMSIKQHQMEAALSSDMLATDWVYYLVRKGVTFRQAHHYIDRVVALAEQRDVDITELPLGELQQICPLFKTDIVTVADYNTNVEQYNVIGGTSTFSIVEQLRDLNNYVKGLRNTSSSP